MTIKVGQVYEMPFTHYPFVVTFIDNDIFSVPSVDIIYEDGEMDVMPIKGIEKLKLLAEYPTWQEAVNSKEFKE